ncbi:unknown [Crocosphaera subtropica ATCC 51142]|uniref:Phosphoribosyltransferase domain-containing protein n=1 Tax=Crocosphaera subtropica (strain ATCC 51142 / BH68) TaxID=43989 RepID=B1WS10_CROS5|nr:phosphoribosyltransferase [Crocosphaera subtropica]ACB50204.1 unknown [Crocosphaera subtropica ATCC 51142]
MNSRFHNRTEAGQQLAEKLKSYKNQENGVVLALPRGGVPVAYEVAKKLNLPLDICLVRKLGVPNHRELAMGAIALGGVRILNTDVINWSNISPQMIEEVTRTEQQELHRREQVYRGDQPFPKIYNQTVILVDDGIATGSTIKAAIAIMKKQQAKKIIIAVPVAPPSVCQELRQEVDELVCLTMPEHMNSISLWYDDFSQTTDQEVCSLLFLAHEYSMTH